ncbi:MAG: dihydroorotate dehydrogenase [Bacteroidales bacterium]|nr:dihydroorotate dehydrogenase [Bacteroidales bacterium]
MVATKDLSVSLCGLRLENPVIPASGTFGFGLELADSFDLNVLGGIALKGTTREARPGNPTPRIAECRAGMINSVGLQNPGIEVLVGEKAPALRKIYRGAIIANISGFSLEEYAFNCARADACPDIDILEVNISCPNVHNGGMAFGTDPAQAAAVTRAVREAVREKPVFIKLSPNVTDIVSIARACEDAGADGLTLVNTFLGMRIDINKRKPVIANKMGGFSGPAVFPVALRMVYQVAHACRIPVMGCGGVSRSEDVVEMMMAGATAVQVGAENIRNPFACPEIIAALPELMDRLGIGSLQEIIGIAA